MTTSNETDDLKAFSRIIEVLQPLERENRIRLLHTVSQFLGLESPSPTSSPSADTYALRDAEHVVSRQQGPFSTDRSASAKQFLLEKQPKTDVERVACLAYYLTHLRDTPHFRTLDISKLNTEAAQPKFTNAHYSVDNATKMGYLAAATKGSKQISAAGEHFVQILPDRDGAKTAMATLLRRRATRKKSKRKSNTSDE